MREVAIHYTLLGVPQGSVLGLWFFSTYMSKRAEVHVVEWNGAMLRVSAMMSTSVLQLTQLMSNTVVR